MNKRGSVPLLVAAAIPTILLTGMFALDATQFWLRQARLQAALDAGALVAARDINSTNRDANVKAIVVDTYNGNSNSGPRLTANDVQVVPTGEDKVEVKATLANITSLVGSMRLLNWKPWDEKRSIVRGAVADRTNTGIELALVIDITLSMVQKDTGIKNQRRIDAAVDSALKLLEVLYGDNPKTPNDATDDKKWLQNLFISVVPFNVTVNYGARNEHFLSNPPKGSGGSDYPKSWTGADTNWGGCVEMRSTSFLDATPSGSSTGLRRYYWPSTYEPNEKYKENLADTASAQPYCRSAAAYNHNDAKYVCMGHNDWTAPRNLLTSKQNKLIISFSTNDLVKAAGLDAWATAHGPNMMCPPDTGDREDNLTVLPLTRDRRTVETRVKALATLPFSYGTNIAAGLQAGWFTLSPNWRKVEGVFDGWPSAEPLPDAKNPRPELPNLPLDYDRANMRKVMILLTDGDNNWSDAREVQGSGSSGLVRPESRSNQGFYGSYGYLGADYPGDDRPTAASTSEGDTDIDSASEEWCRMIRASTTTNGPEKITIYTVGFGSGIGTRATNVLTRCASLNPKTGKRLYYKASTAEDLLDAFTAIGNDLADLRLTQ